MSKKRERANEDQDQAASAAKPRLEDLGEGGGAQQQDKSAESAQAAAESSAGIGYANLGTAKYLADEVKAIGELRHERTLAGTGTAGRGDGQFVCPHQITLDSNDNVIVADMENHRLQAISSSGDYMCKIGVKGQEDGMFNWPTGVAMNKRSGELFVSDTHNHRIQVLVLDREPTASFRHLRTFGSEGSGPNELSYPHHIAVSESSGHVYVADSSNKRVQVFTSGGDHVRSITCEQLREPWSIALDENDVMYVADYTSDCVFVFSSEDGSLMSTIGSHGQFNYPSSICIDQHRGHVVVGDRNGMHVFKKEDGSFVCKLEDKAFDTSGLCVDSEGRIIASNYYDNTIERWA